MIFNDRVAAFHKLRINLLNLSMDSVLYNTLNRAQLNNPWFTVDNSQYAISQIINMLDPHHLNKWASSYHFSNKLKKVGVVIPSNIPLVGFYDMLCVLLSGNIFIARLSSSNNVLLPYIAHLLFEIDIRFRKLIFFDRNINNIDFLLATGGDNSASYFDFHFSKIDKIIRSHKNSLAIINGDESLNDYKGLARDIFLYFGLGCRSVSKLFLPYGFDFNKLKRAFLEEVNYMQHDYYYDNYRYQKTLFILNKVDFIDFDNILLIESNELDSPISVLYYEYYQDISSVMAKISLNHNSIQCVLLNASKISNTIKFGYAQKPTLWDSPDNVDVMDVLQFQ